MPAAKRKKFRPPPPNPNPAQASAPAAAARAEPPPAKSESSPARETPPLAATPVWQVLLAALVIVLAGILAYSNSFHDAFVLDDLPAIKENPSIQHGWAAPAPPATKPAEILEQLFERLPAPLQPPNDGQTVTGRPLVNVSFELNYAWAKAHDNDGFYPTPYHRVSLAIHLLAALALFGLVRRTLELPKLRATLGAAALPVAAMAALLWTVHPIQTEAVTYISQRAESLMGLFYLLTMYCFARGTQQWPWLWFPLAALSAMTAGLCKEVTATLPVMILLYDWVFVANKPDEPWRRRWPAYLGLLLAMLPLAWLVHHAGNRGRSAGFGLGVAWYDYALAQFPAIMHYLRLVVWPYPLTLDYGDTTGLATQPFTLGDAAAMLAVVALVAGTIYLLCRKPALGFLGAWFFIILAPSSSVLPVITEPAAEHRMYLPLAALAVLAALGLWKLWRWRAWPAALALTTALAALTFARNYDYRSGMSLWKDTVVKHPDIARAHENYGIMLYERGRAAEAVAEFMTAERIKPDYADCDNNLGNALGSLGQNEEAVKYYLRAIPRLVRPVDQAVASYNLGNALHSLGRLDDAVKAYNYAGNLAHYGPAFNNMGSIYAQQKDYAQAIAAYQEGLSYQPDFPQCEVNLADAYAQTNQFDLAEQHYLHALQENPNYADAYGHLGVLYTNEGKLTQAAAELQKYIQMAPNLPEAHYYYGFCLAKMGQQDNAIHEFEAALKINPNYSPARSALADLNVNVGG